MHHFVFAIDFVRLTSRVKFTSTCTCQHPLLPRSFVPYRKHRFQQILPTIVCWYFQTLDCLHGLYRVGQIKRGQLTFLPTNDMMPILSQWKRNTLEDATSTDTGWQCEESRVALPSPENTTRVILAKNSIATCTLQKITVHYIPQINTSKSRRIFTIKVVC